jgi:hypothetical protein
MKKFETYPDGEKTLYYIEIDNERRDVTLYRRNFISDFNVEHPLMDGEVHPYKIFRNTIDFNDMIPDIDWYKWMVDKLNS